MTSLPTLYIPHGGGPCFFMQWDPADAWKGLEKFLRGLAATLPKPKAIMVISAHWEESEFTLGANAKPPLIYDYSGFPPHTYKLAYPASGTPSLANEAAEILRMSDIPAELNATRGWDHGLFIPFMLIYPQADIPLFQLSLKRGLDPAAHIRVGHALTPLREQGVLIVGSGMSYHNLRRFGPEAESVSVQFDDWLTGAVCQPDAQKRNTLLTEWQKAPAAREAHPREEHLLPLMVAAGAAGNGQGQQIYSDRVMGMAISAYRFA